MSEISVSTAARDMNPAAHGRFQKVNPAARARFAELVSTSVWSPIIWEDGIRKKSRYKSCAYAALDFDSGEWTIETARVWVQERGLAALVGTSKSHQRAKGEKPPCDRFRLVIPFARPIEDRFEYEAVMTAFTTALPCDKACVDAARYFFPSPVVWASGLPGRIGAVEETLAILGGRPELSAFSPPSPAALRRVHFGVIEHQEEEIAEMLEDGIPPVWAQDLLRRGPLGGASRHSQCYRLGVALSRGGWPTERIIRAIMHGPMAAIGEHDVRRAVENGAAAGVELSGKNVESQKRQQHERE